MNTMPEPFLKIIDLFFIGFHTSLILFNVFGWLVPRWRFANFISLSLTAFSWFILGIWFGWGYCVCTDWHWQIREMLGYQNTSSSYIHFLILELTNIDIREESVDIYTAIVFVAAFLISFYLNLRKWKAKNIRRSV
ncbi:DUF2784 family protein [Lutimonas vermicola]|uniref:DUF2784 family protein n=1 Tax=Lutimonas vermicola TaxID=414288 RepID=A0ABU9L4U1_9FLAO